MSGILKFNEIRLCGLINGNYELHGGSMKFSAFLIFGLLVSGQVFAQAGDLGQILPENLGNNFKITKNQVTFNRPVTGKSNSAMKPNKEVHDFNEKLSSLEREVKVEIEREYTFIRKITTTNDETRKIDKKKVKKNQLQIMEVHTNGKVASVIDCAKDEGIINNTFDCTVINHKVCGYFTRSENSDLNNVLSAELDKCNNLMTKIADHQKALSKLSDKDFNRNMKNGISSKENNLYNRETKDLNDLVAVARGYSDTYKFCNSDKVKLLGDEQDQIETERIIEAGKQASKVENQ